MKEWRFLQYISPQGRAAIDDWRRSIREESARAAFDIFLRTMSRLAVWSAPDLATLKGARYRGLTELRWRSGHKPYRILGYESGERTYTMLVGCTHDGKKYEPRDAFETALRRKKAMDRGEAQAHEYQLITDEGITQ